MLTLTYPTRAKCRLVRFSRMPNGILLITGMSRPELKDKDYNIVPSIFGHCLGAMIFLFLIGSGPMGGDHHPDRIRRCRLHRATRTMVKNRGKRAFPTSISDKGDNIPLGFRVIGTVVFYYKTAMRSGLFILFIPALSPLPSQNRESP